MTLMARPIYLLQALLVNTPPAGVTTQEEAGEIMSSLAEDGGANSSSEAGHQPYPSRSSLPLNWNSPQWRD